MRPTPMKTIRNGEVWFSTLEEALDDAEFEQASHLADTASKLSVVLASLHAGAVVVAGWAVLQQLLRQR